MVQGSLLLHKADDEKKHGAKSSNKQDLHRRPTSHAGMHLDLEIFLVIGLVVDSWSLRAVSLAYYSCILAGEGSVTRAGVSNCYTSRPNRPARTQLYHIS